MSPVGQLVVQEYDPRWPAWFEDLRGRIAPQVQGLALSVEHVGSTSVPGCAAKPIIDVDIVVADASALPEVTARLVAGLGYRHEGNLGIEGREAYRHDDASIEHHAYAVVAGSKPHLDHVLLRDHLRRDPEAVRRYSELKTVLAARFASLPDARTRYAEAKNALVEELIAAAAAR
ncbi:GrpB family protein [Streptomyces flavofungini]|uniref:GrpB family protein n=1 Tax=Streptomyces flavofungini TaxID=68200 RepID=UPI0034DF3966